MKKKEVVMIVIPTLLITYIGMTIMLQDFLFPIDLVMVLAMFVGPITIGLHLLGVVLTKTGIKLLYFLIFIPHIILTILIFYYQSSAGVLAGGSGFILVFFVFPSFTCNSAVALYYFVYYQKQPKSIS